jgi:hypothetical protein
MTSSDEEAPQSLSQKLSKYFKLRVMFQVLTESDIRYFISAGAVGFFLAILFDIACGPGRKLEALHPFPIILIWWFMLFYLSCLEGVQAALVALTPIDPKIYEKSHPITYMCTTLCFKGNTLDKFIIGRQFLVIFVVFMIGFCTGYDGDRLVDNPLGVPDGFRDSLIKLGFVGALTTIVIGQLISQVVASKCNIDYLNYRFQYYAVIGVCLFMEFTGLMHAVYMVQKFVVALRGTDEAKRKQVENQGNPIFFWVRVLFSTAVLGLCVAVVFDSLFRGATGFADVFSSLPNWLGVIFFILLCTVVHCTEGLQVALFAMQKMDPEEFKVHAGAEANGAVAFAGNNLQCFLIGRQALTAMSMFVLSTICGVQANLTKEVEFTNSTGTFTKEEGYTILGLGNGISTAFLETGLSGAVVLTIMASLSGQVIASAFPLGFCGFPGMWIVLYACLLTEFIGLTHFAWPLADGVQALMGNLMQNDEVYLGGKHAGAIHQDKLAPDDGGPENA